MTEQTSIANVLAKTKANWPESNSQISPEILRIHRISAHCQQNLSLVLSPYGLQVAEFSVLETIRKEKLPYSLTPTELSRAMLFSSGGLTKVLNRMDKAGLIQRIENPNDKRGKLVQLSESGQKLINLEEKEQLNYLLNKILRVWEEDA